MSKKLKEEIDPSETLSAFMKENKKDHFNYEEEVNYKVSTGSLTFDSEIGGIGPGIHRLIGNTEGGKTSFMLEVMRNFLLADPKRRGVLIKAEGRLGSNIKERSGVTFVTDPEEWKDGTCFVFEGNIYETVMSLFKRLVDNNPQGIKYFFCIDSMDGLIRRDDEGKSPEEALKVAGGALITADFLRRMSLVLTKRGHIAFFISQIRATGIGEYSKAPPKFRASGGNAALHYPDFIFDFQERHKSEMILVNPDAKYGDKDFNKALGHWAKVIVRKSTNETSGTTILYPIKYGRTGGKSIWREKEVLDLLLANEFIKKGGSWFTMDLENQWMKEAKEKFPDMPEKVQGITKLEEFIDIPEVCDFFYQKFASTII